MIITEYKKPYFDRITSLQKSYVEELIAELYEDKNKQYESINFNSATGTGKTFMVIDLINSMPDHFFVVTTLTKGAVRDITNRKLHNECLYDNFIVYGNCDLSENTVKKAEDFVGEVTFLADGKPIIWVRDESHIKTANFSNAFSKLSEHIVNFSATNNSGYGVTCDFSNTIMLRRVNQEMGTPWDALQRLIEVKEQHKSVKGYNPCAIFRDYSDIITDKIKDFCKELNLKYIDLSTTDYDISKLCEDDNEYDVIINKNKIVEGTDIKRAHIFYMSNDPQNNNTIIQCVGRCRRNALLYSDSIDICAPENKELLDATMNCYVFFNDAGTILEEDAGGNLVPVKTDALSCENLNEGKVSVKCGVNQDGFKIMELDGETGEFEVYKDLETGFKCVNPETSYYATKYSYHMGRNNFAFKKGDEVHNILIDDNTIITAQDGNLTFKNSFILDKSISLAIIDELRKVCIDKKAYAIDLGENRYKRWELHYFVLSSGTAISLANIPPNTLTAYTVKNWLNIKLEERIKVLTRHIKSIDDIVQSYNDDLNNIKFSIYLPDNTKLSIDEFEAYVQTNPIKIDCNKVTGRYDEFIIPPHRYFEYTKIRNDRELGLIGTDGAKATKNKETGELKTTFVRPVTERTSFNSSKLTRFINNRYPKQIEFAKSQLSEFQAVDPNDACFPAKCNSCRGYLVEYIIKTMLYGVGYLRQYYIIKKAEYKGEYNEEAEKQIIFDACMMMYKDEMKHAYGNKCARLLKTPSPSDFIRRNYKRFRDMCYEYAEKGFEFVKEWVKPETKAFNDYYYDPNLSVDNLSAKCDILDKHIIIDIKATGVITIQHIRQILAYHYLSTKRNDLDIRTVIVYDVISGHWVKLNV